LTGTLRFSQSLNADWRWTAQLGKQRLENDDFTAFPFGCSSEGNFDRFCSDGTFDYYDFRSENEKRRQNAATLNLKGKVMTGAVAHDLSIGLLAGKVRNRFEPYAFNWVGIGHIDGTAVVPEDPTLAFQSTNRDERTVELSLQDAIRWNDNFTTWLGVRHTRLNRESVLTDGSAATAYDQRLTTPWIAASYKVSPTVMAYASHGQGMESEVAPANPLYSNAGRPLPALKSRQTEIGIKGQTAALRWNAALFNITRPMSGDFGICTLPGTCTRQADGEARHRGLELSANAQNGPWTLDGGLTLLDAKRQGAGIDPSLNGKRPINVPSRMFRAGVAYRVAALPGLSVEGKVSHEGRRPVLADESIMLSAWTRFDAALRYETKVAGKETTWTLGIDNIADKRYWKESPTQFGHVYLYPGAPRTLRLSVTAAL
jgi:iron complex outermembrane receptor protein